MQLLFSVSKCGINLVFVRNRIPHTELSSRYAQSIGNKDSVNNTTLNNGPLFINNVFLYTLYIHHVSAM